MNMLDDQMEYELIQKIADPILDKLLDMQEEMGDEACGNPIRVQITSPDLDENRIPTDGCLTDQMATREFLSKLECYLQQQLDLWNRPTILH